MRTRNSWIRTRHPRVTVGSRDAGRIATGPGAAAAGPDARMLLALSSLASPSRRPIMRGMSDHVTHGDHPHVHGPDCGHQAIEHDGHVDYLHDGHLHHPHEDHVDEHVIAVDAAHPDGHTEPAGGHDDAHVHGPDCGHPAVPHGDHVDYLVDGVLHHPHDGHCDDHGAVALAG